MNAFRGQGIYAGSWRIVFRGLGGGICGEDVSMVTAGYAKPEPKG